MLKFGIKNLNRLSTFNGTGQMRYFAFKQMREEDFDNHPFLKRHIGPNFADQKKMLNELGFESMQEFIEKVVPKSIKLDNDMKLPESLDQSQVLEHLKGKLQKNKIFRSYIGLGFYNTHVPPPILRNVFENPGWYTAYTPYQPEISQGRMESLLNYQTMIIEMTKLPVANASLLDEDSAACEAMFLAVRKTKRSKILIDKDCSVTTMFSLKSRAEPIDVEVKIVDRTDFVNEIKKGDSACVIVPYPDSYGNIYERKLLEDISASCKETKTLFCVNTDLMALTKITPPGEFGADICFGSAQRFGVPVGFGGPSAAFFAVTQPLLRMMPGRIIGVSKDTKGRDALRLTLQTREQHIKRDKANSNICTSQALLANMSAFYAIYHGPKGLKKIGERIHQQTIRLAAAISQKHEIINSCPVYDTIHVRPSCKVDDLRERALEKKINLRYVGDGSVCISLDETIRESDLEDLMGIFSVSSENTNSCKKIEIPSDMLRKSPFLTQKVFNTYHDETRLMRYIKTLENKDFSLVHSMIPLGSCTMKLNAAVEIMPCSWPEVNSIHPYAPRDQIQGYVELLSELEQYLEEITGYDKVCLTPNSGAQGEYAGMRAIYKYNESIGQSHKKICLIPVTAHGTNPASAVLAGFTVKPIPADKSGGVDIVNLKEMLAKYKDQVGAIMVTYPSTSGVFDDTITEVCHLIHEAGGQVYLDGANMNAMVGLCKPGLFGSDVSHLNLHKTFCIPHGGGGPGVGPIGVKKHLIPFLPNHALFNSLANNELNKVDLNLTHNLGVCSAPFGSASIDPIPWSYIRLMGNLGLRQASEVSILSANFMKNRLDKYYKAKFTDKNNLCAHEFIIDCTEFEKHASVVDIAKRLMDFGFHSPTMSWPYPNGLMIEPTESESFDECSRFVQTLIQIREEINDVIEGRVEYKDSPLANAPHCLEDALSDNWPYKYSRETACFPGEWQRKRFHGNQIQKVWPTVSRINDTFGDKNVVCSCPSMDEYENDA